MAHGVIDGESASEIIVKNILGAGKKHTNEFVREKVSAIFFLASKYPFYLYVKLMN
jgi:hypothetical protein